MWIYIRFGFLHINDFLFTNMEPTPLNHPRDTSGETPTTPLPLGVLDLNLGVGLYYR